MDDEQYITIENDTCYVHTPLYEWGNCVGVAKSVVMTKETFKECYKKWILGDEMK